MELAQTSNMIADADEGEDGELYEQMGYMRRSARSVLQTASRARNVEKASGLRTPEKEAVG